MLNNHHHMAADRILVLSNHNSAFALRVLIALNEKEVQYEVQEEDLSNKSQLLLESNPVHKKVPVLIHNDKVICESLIAVQYIDEACSSKGNSFLPDDPFERAVARFWCDFIDTKCADAMYAVLKSPAGERRETAANDMKDGYKTLDSAVRDVAAGKPYFGGDSIGLIDIALAPLPWWFKPLEELGDFKLPNAEECPHIQAWAARVVKWKSVKQAMALTSPEQLLALAKFARSHYFGINE